MYLIGMIAILTGDSLIILILYVFIYKTFPPFSWKSPKYSQKLGMIFSIYIPCLTFFMSMLNIGTAEGETASI